MRANERFRFVAIVGLIVALLTAGIGLAGDAIETPDEPQPTVCASTEDEGGDGAAVDSDDEVSVDDPAEDVAEGDEPAGSGGESEEPSDDTGGTDDQAETGDPGGNGDEEDVDEGCEGVDEGTTAEDAAAQTKDPVEPGETHDVQVSECTGAAQLEGGVPTEPPVPGELHGLENAIAHVLWNCLDHPNHGLVNALTKLHDKLDRWLERRAAHEERRAEREAAKAERETAREAAKAARDAEHEAAKAAREVAKAAEGRGGAS